MLALGLDRVILQPRSVWPTSRTCPRTSSTPLAEHRDVFDGTRLGVVGFSNEDIPELTKPSALDPFHVEPRLARVQAEVDRLRARKIGPIVVMGHDGATAGTLTDPTGPLVDLADALTGVDVLIGDHTDIQMISTRRNGTLVVENRSKGIRFTRVRLLVDTATKEVVYKTADFHRPWNVGVTKDQAIQARIDELNAQLAPILSTVIGSSTRFIPRVRRVRSVGRAHLRVARRQRGRGRAADDGAELKTMLENGVSRMPAADGRFPQVSGLCVTYDISAAAGHRVTGAVRQAIDGTGMGAPVDLMAASAYTLAENDFMVAGGDGYPNFASRATTHDIMDQTTTADYIAANSPISPAIQGRITCITSGATACPVPVP